MKHSRILLLATVTTTLLLSGCGAKITQTADSIDVELGEKLEFNTSDFFSSDNPTSLDELVVDTSKVNTAEPGTYEITVAYKNSRYTVSVNVQDTTAPVIALKEELPSAEAGATINAADYVDVEDKSDCKVYFLIGENEDEKMVLSEDNSIQKIVAVDSAGNRSEPLTVEIPISLEIIFSMEGCSYDESTGKYTLSEEIEGELYMRHEEIMAQVKNEDLRQALYDYLFEKDMSSINWELIKIKVAPMGDAGLENFLDMMGYYKKPEPQKPSTSKPSSGSSTANGNTGGGTANNVPEEATGNGGYLDPSEWVDQDLANEILNGEYDDTDYGDITIY